MGMGTQPKKKLQETPPVPLQDTYPPYPDFQKTFKLTTDASDHAVGTILTQVKDGVDMPVAYFSKTMNACEKKYANMHDFYAGGCGFRTTNTNLNTSREN